jgi:hypothetical protein
VNLASAYRALLRLYPQDYFDSFAGEMLEVFASAALPPSRFLPEFAGLLGGLCREWIAKLTTDRAVRGRVLPDLRMMRPAGVSKEAWFSESAIYGYRKAAG